MVDPKKRVLVVEDEEAIRSLIESALSAVYDVRTARDGDEARAIIQEDYDPHGIVTDYNYPAGPGVDLAKEVISSGKVPSLKGVVLISGGNDAQTASNRVSELQNSNGIIYVFLQKPFSSMKSFVATVAQTLEQRVESPQ